MPSIYEEFIERRDILLTPTVKQSARELAMDIVELLELIAVHGSSGIDGKMEKRTLYIDRLTDRIINVTEDH